MKDNRKVFVEKKYNSQLRFRNSSQFENGNSYSDVIVISGPDTLEEPLTLNRWTLKYDWKEVKIPVSFEEAYNDCKENGNNYYDPKHNQKLVNDYSNEIRMRDGDGEEVICMRLDVDWYKE